MESTEKKPKKYVKKVKPKIEVDEEPIIREKIIVDRYDNYKYFLSLNQFVL